MQHTDTRWFAAVTKRHKEQVAAVQFGNQGFGSFFPRHRKAVRHAGKVTTRYAPFFPGYIFVEMDLGRVPVIWGTTSATGPGKARRARKHGFVREAE